MFNISTLTFLSTTHIIQQHGVGGLDYTQTEKGQAETQISQ